jgi:hypothetical protein
MQADVQDNSDGTYAVYYTAPVEDTYTINISFLGTFAGIAGGYLRSFCLCCSASGITLVWLALHLVSQARFEARRSRRRSRATCPRRTTA